MIKYLPADILRKHHSNIDVTYKQILLAAKNKVKFHHQQLQLAGQQISMSDPAAVLRRGYAIIRQNNKILTRARQYDAKDEVEIQFADATIKISKK
ncbi:MAG: hypothetical protein IPJ13_07705 [Saprospiraceae bacterium]|nr:hypothetical protein [Saprospiraceae bacterium]